MRFYRTSLRNAIDFNQIIASNISIKKITQNTCIETFPVINLCLRKNKKPPNFTNRGTKVTKLMNESIKQLKFRLWCCKFGESNTKMELSTSFPSWWRGNGKQSIKIGRLEITACRRGQLPAGNRFLLRRWRAFGKRRNSTCVALWSQTFITVLVGLLHFRQRHFEGDENRENTTKWILEAFTLKNKQIMRLKFENFECLVGTVAFSP